MSTKLVVFDLGGVIVRINHTWEGAMRSAGIQDVPSQERKLVDSKLLDSYQAGAIEDDEYLDLLRQELSLCTAEEALQVHDHILDSPYEGTVEIIEALKRQRIKTACLSNTNKLHWEEMLETERFPNVLALDFRLASHELRLSKPDPAIFKACEDACGFGSHEIVFFDDGAGHVEAAREAGWNAFVIEAGNAPFEQMKKKLGELGILQVG